MGLLDGAEYSFIRKDARFNGRVILGIVCGSRAYGIARPDSDYDVRCIALDTKNDILRCKGGYVYTDAKTDTVITSNAKLMHSKISINLLEMLWQDRDKYIILDEYGELLLDNREAFTSKSIIHEYIGIIRNNLKSLRLVTMSVVDTYREENRLEYLQDKLRATLKSLNMNENDILISDRGGIKMNMSGITEVDLESMYQIVSRLKDSASSIDKNKGLKYSRPLNKIQGHIIRMYDQGIELFKTGEITVDVSNNKMVRECLDGAFITEGNQIKTEFFDICDKMESEMLQAYNCSKLKEKADYDMIRKIELELSIEALRRG